MILINDMYKIYKMGRVTVNALNGINLHIKEKEFTAIIGPSGSGKSTLMNMIGCLDIPTSGSYKIEGKEVSRLGENQLANIRNKKIGFIFQQFNLLSKLTAIENVELPLVYMGYSGSKRRKMAEAALDRVGLLDRLKHKPSELSGGQQQRVAIARALSSKPALILADEPTGALDSKSGVEVMNMLRELHGEGRTIIIITHDSDIAGKTNRIVKIQDGHIISDEPNVRCVG